MEVERSFDKVRRKMVQARIEFMSKLALFSQDELKMRPTGHDWSPLLIAYHLYITDGLALEQMQRVQDEENPLIEDGGREAPQRTNAAESPASLEAVLAGMAARREEIFTYLADLPEEAWVRPFRHEEWGPRKFYQLVNVLPQHDQAHAQQLVEIKNALNK